MAKEADDNLNLEPTATRELINASIEAVKSQDFDINPYSVAREAGIAPETLFTNRELMSLVIAARGDQSSFSIDSHLLERCQEQDGELAKLLEINQEIYDRALEMEERVIQLEAKITDMEQDAENLTMQLQNSWHLGYKKGLNDGQNQETRASQRSIIDIELPKEELPEKEVPATKSAIDIELPKEKAAQSIKSIIDIELPKEEPVQSIKSLIDIELPKEEPVQSIKSLIDIELPKEEPVQSIKSLIDIELPKEEPVQSIKSLIDIELPKEEPVQSIKSIIDIELPKEQAMSQSDFNADEGRVTLENPPISDDYEPATESPAAQEKDLAAGELPPSAVSSPEPDATPSYNDRVFNAVSDNWAPGNLPESYGGLSWREVETIYQFSASSGAAGANLVFEPLAPGQAVGARAIEKDESKGFDSQSVVSGDAVAAGDAESNGGTRGETQPLSSHGKTQPLPSRGETQPLPSRSDTQPIVAPAQTANDTAAPPILKADAVSPAALVKPSPTSTFTNLRSKRPEGDADPPMELTMNQFLGDTNSYIDLDRVTMVPLDEVLPPQQPQALSPADNQSQFALPSQAETQTLVGATQALAAAARARAAAATSDAGAAASPTASASERPTTPPLHTADTQSNRRDANATYDGLTALETDTTSDVLDLEKLDIFEGLEDIDELSQIEVIEDVVIPDATPTPDGGLQAPSTQSRPKSSDPIPVISTDDLHDLIKSRIKKAEEPHEPPRIDAFISPHSAEKTVGAGTGTSTNAIAGSGQAATSGTTSATNSGSTEAPGAEASAPPPIPTAKELEALRQGARNKFVGGKAAAGSPIGGAAASGGDSPISASSSHAPTGGVSSRAVPPEIRKACMILGVRPEDLTLKEVQEKWKSQLSAPGVHPDQGGDTESAIYLNTAKDTLVKWINDQAPKLGKKFGKKDEK